MVRVPCIHFISTFGPLYPQVLHRWIQPTMDRKYLGKKILESSKKQNLNLSQTSSYLYSIYIVLGIISNLEMI